MADFVAVLRKTLDGLDNPSPEMRKKVYEKARTTIAAKLAAISPPPPSAVIDGQKAALEKAITEIEGGFGPTRDEDPLAEFVSGAAFGTQSAESAATDAPAHTQPEPVKPAEPQPIAPAATTTLQPAPAPAKSTETTGGSKPASTGSRPAEGAKKRSNTGLIAAVIVILLLAGAGYAVWQNKEDFAQLVGLEHMLPGAEKADMADGAEQAAPDDAGDQAVGDNADDQNTGAGEATNEAGAESEQKFTQRLMEDGSETDPGPAGDEPTVGEGTSVAAANTETDGGAAGADPAAGGNSEEEAADEAGETGATAPEGTTLPVGQRAIFYEERTSDLQGSAEAGAVVWSLVEESPGGNLPPEAAIRAEATIPGKDIQFRMTIRRNGDESLPASHIIEMIFITPDDFDGGGIENVLRITFKDSEQSAGNPLLGIPAKISDGFFLLALTDSKADIEANTTMMRRLDWLDVPLVYSSGRRALITMEKGVPGAKIFDDALKAWTPESSG